MIKIARMEFNLQDDPIFKRIALALYAQGCKWGCKGCHSKDLWDFEGGKSITPDDVINRIEFMNLTPDSITIVGQGGDFWFQRDEWVIFCRELKKAMLDIKIFWQTGASKEMVKEYFTENGEFDIFPFDAIACERPFANKTEGENNKYLYLRKKDNNFVMIAEGWKII